MFPILAGSNPSGYNLTRSLRFRSSASAYLNRTPASATNRKTWTWSGWVKRGALGTTQIFFEANTSPTLDDNHTDIRFTSSDTLMFFSAETSASINLVTTQVFRDPSAWYHIVCVLDTAQATASNRVKIYVNGLQVTAFSTATYPSQNYDAYINNTVNHRIGNYQPSNLPFDGYLTEVNFIDGQALTPSSFGSTNTLTGVWQPARYGGTYGTNGFYLPFTDNSALTTSSNVGLGKDFSGNGNYWTTNNISITSGVTYDSMTDVPTLTSATAANFAVLNPISTSSVFTLSNANQTFSASATTSATYYVGSTIGVSSGKWYWELIPTDVGSGPNISTGIRSVTDSNVTGTNGIFQNGYGYSASGNKIDNSGSTSYGASWTVADVIGVALDMNAGTITFYKNNSSQGTAFTGITGTYAPSTLINVSGATRTIAGSANFGQRPFTYTPPTGFVALNTFNLPTGTILKGNTVMDATLYTGTLLSNAITNAAAFKPDLVWVKSRSAATDNKLTDSVRGVTKGLISNTTGAETTDTQGLTAINSNGFTVGTNTDYNNLAATYVAWQWQAGQGSSSSNTNGTITSTVSVNASAGFSVVTYTGTGSLGTVGHGLGVAPSMMIFKNRSGTNGWLVYQSTMGIGFYLVLNSTAAKDNTAVASVWNNTSPTSSVFTVNTDSTVNTNGSNYVAYCWTPIAGFSAFGSYTGNGSTDGPFVYTGFRPRFVAIKSSSATGNWVIIDTARDTYNVSQNRLFPNLSNAESAYPWIDVVSNGFKVRDNSSDINTNGTTYIYMAFAENPTKFALAR